MKKTVCFILTFLSMGFTLAAESDVERQFERLKRAGYETSQFADPRTEISPSGNTYKMQFACIGNNKPSQINFAKIVSEIGGAPYSLIGDAETTFQNNSMIVNLFFLTDGPKTVEIYLYVAGGSWEVLRYAFNIKNGAGYDSIAPEKEDNIPVYPTGYLHQAGIKMRNISQKYLFNECEKSWSITFKDVSTETVYFDITRPGAIYDRNNIAMTKSGSTTRYDFKFPTEGVYFLKLLNSRNRVLAFWKVRVTLADQEAIPNKNDQWFTGDRRIALLAQDLPFDWEMSVYNLAMNLKNSNLPELELHELIFDWVTTNVDYDNYHLDYYKYNTLEFSHPGFARTSNLPHLYFRTAVCDELAELSSILSNSAGLKDFKIDGQNLSGNRGSRPQWWGHSWNAVKLDDSWYFYDTTWKLSRRDPRNFASTRSIEQISRWEPFEPEELVYPDPKKVLEEMGSQFTIFTDPANLEKFPSIYPDQNFYELGFDLLNVSPRTYLVESGKRFSFKIAGKKGLNTQLQCYVEGESDPIINISQLHYEEGMYKAELVFPKNGTYFVSFTAKSLEDNRQKASVGFLFTVSDKPKMSSAVSTPKLDIAGTYQVEISGQVSQTITLSATKGITEGICTFKGLRLKGSVSGLYYNGTWTLPNGQSGWFSFTFDPKAREFSGQWGATSGHVIGQWTGKRQN